MESSKHLSPPTPRQAVLLIPDGGLYLSLRLPRIMQEAGMAVDLLCLRGHPLARSRYVRNVHAAANWAEIEIRVADYLRQPKNPWRKIMVIHEPSVRRLLAKLDPAVLKTWQPGAQEPLVREFFAGKFGLIAAAKEWDLLIPTSRVCHNADEVMTFGADAGWPVIVKPPNQLGGHGIRKLGVEREVETVRENLRFPLLAQKFINGRRVVIDMFCSGGRLLAWLPSYSIAQGKGPYSYSTGRLHCAMPGLTSLVEKIARHSGFEGFCSIDCIEESGSNRCYFLEFNPRATSGWRFVRQCGVNLTEGIQSWIGRQIAFPAPLTLPPGLKVQSHYFGSDLIRCIRQSDWQGLRHWLPWSHSCHDVPWDDPWVLFAATGARCKTIMTQNWK